MQSFPLFVKLSGRRVLLAGGAGAALAKLRLLVSAGARVHVVAPDIMPEIQTLAARSGGDIRIGRFEPSDLIGVDLVFAANEDEATDSNVAEAARGEGKLVNSVDRPSLCDFTMPAIVDRGPIVVAVSTEGASPVLSQRVRAAIEGVLPPRLGRLAEFARRFRGAVASRINGNAERRAFWAGVLDGPIGQAVVNGDEARAAGDLIRALNRKHIPADKGQVWLVGAGPGDPELLTLKAARVLREADVVIHDRLVEPAILEYARRDARRIFVGKAKGDQTLTQSQINALLIAEARGGRKVVRLKGGDPFVFGRGGEEVEALRQAGIAVEIIPGITAALGCAAAAGIPLTHRDHASRLIFVSGHDRDGLASLDWAGLADPRQTIVVYMGVSAAAGIAGDLTEAGLSASTPIAVIENGTRWNERVIKGSLGELAHLVARNGIGGPALLVIGSVAALAKENQGGMLAMAAE